MDEDRTRDAWHEAGHGLLCALEFGGVARLSIVPSERVLARQVGVGFAHLAPVALLNALAPGADPSVVAAVRRRARAGVRWCLAGSAAESVYARARAPHEYTDELLMLGYATVAAGNESEPRERLIRHEERAVRRWLGAHRRHLEAVVGALLAGGSIDDDGFWAAIKRLPSLRSPRAWAQREVGASPNPRAQAAEAPSANVHVVRALLAVARFIHSEVERANRLTDDVPEAALATVARWCDGGAPVQAVYRAREELYERRANFAQRAIPDAGPDLMGFLLCVLRGLTSYVWGASHTPRSTARESVLVWSARILEELGEPKDAARACVEVLYTSALGPERHWDGA